jgi:hypothetical protein
MPPGRKDFWGKDFFGLDPSFGEVKENGEDTRKSRKGQRKSLNGARVQAGFLLESL